MITPSTREELQRYVKSTMQMAGGKLLLSEQERRIDAGAADKIRSPAVAEANRR
jgi:hypothetical protein